MAVTRPGKKILKITGISLGILLVLLTCFHFWFKAHAKGLIEDLVESKSNGKLKLKIKKFHFSYFSKKIEIEKAVFYTTDTLNATTAYRFSIEKMKLKAKAILPIVFKKQILIESIILLNPHIEVARLRAADKTGKKEKKDISIPEEIGKVYTSIQDALQVLQVKLFQIDNGTFTLINRITPDQQPMTITNLHFHIDNLQVDPGKLTGNEKLLFSDNIVLRTNNQDITFPDGRHRLSFSKFRINLRKKLVEFDSCTISATRTDSSASSFNVFFDALFLTNIDFDTLYKHEVIKADSVYCLNPKFNLTVETAGKKKDSGKPSRKLEKIIEELTGNIQLGYVLVSNADFNINTIKNGVPSSFTFSNNNFQMTGMEIDEDAPKPIKVKSFAMAIRNYENFIKDSSYSINFDSVLFKDDHITLSNFVFNNLENGKTVNSFSIPQFNLLGLSWEDLVFERKLKAEQAIMFYPYISYSSPAVRNKKRGSQTIFQSLGAIKDYMDLQQLDIREGKIDLKLKKDLSVKLDNATLSIKSQSLLESKKMSGIKNSLTRLNFDRGTIHAGNLEMELHDIHYIGQSGQFGASSINVKNKQKTMAISLQDISVEKMKVDEVSGNVYAEGVTWEKGEVKINAAVGKNDNGESTVELKNVRGANTTISGIFGGKSISTKLNHISFGKLDKRAGSKLILDGLDLTGTQLKVKGNSLNLSIADYDITDNKSSSFRQIDYKSSNGKTEAAIAIPSLAVTPHVQVLLNGDIALDAVQMIKPVISLRLDAKKTGAEKNKPGLPNIDISDMKLSQPVVSFVQAADSGLLTLEWHGEKNAANFLQAGNLHTKAGSTSVSDLKFYLTDFIFANPKGKSFSTGDGKVAAEIKNIRVEQQEDQPVTWNAHVSHFDARDFRLDSLGKSKANLVMNSGIINNLHISSSTLTDFQKLAAANAGFQVRQLTGNFSDARTNLSWYNAGFDRSNNVFSLDSFSMIPVLSRDSFLAKQTFQTDYISLKSGAVTIGPVDIATYIRDKTLNIGTAAIDRFFFTDYKDRQLPFNAGIIKPLPVNILKSIPQKLTVDTVLLTQANAEYTELNEKTKEAGTIPVTRMNIRFLDVKNYNFGPTDSLRIQATGYLMDSIWIRLRVKESYTDTLGGFLMTVRIKPADLTILNPALIPLASVKLESGYLDTLSLRAVGREYLSLGEMKMFYHHLKIRLLKNGDQTKKTFLTGLLTFLANSFIIKNKNSSRVGNIFFIRDRDRSAINYLIKITMSGIASSVAIKK